jgi:hypothetical protein
MKVFNDVVLRKKCIEDVIDRYLTFVKTGYESFVLPVF